MLFCHDSGHIFALPWPNLPAVNENHDLLLVALDSNVPTHPSNSRYVPALLSRFLPVTLSPNRQANLSETPRARHTEHTLWFCPCAAYSIILIRLRLPRSRVRAPARTRRGTQRRLWIYYRTNRPLPALAAHKIGWRPCLSVTWTSAPNDSNNCNTRTPTLRTSPGRHVPVPHICAA